MTANKTKLTADDWLDIALQVLAEGGINAVAVEPLAKRMGVTKGSFYWHFKNRKELLSKLLEFWENLEQTYQARIVSENQSPEQLLRAVLKIQIEDATNKRVFLALSNELHDTEIREVYLRAVNRRIALYLSIYESLGLNKEEAQNRAALTYLTYLGIIKSLQDGSAKNLANYSIEQLVDMVINSAFVFD